MEKQNEKTLFACMAVVEEAAKQAEALRTQAETAVKVLPERVAMEIGAHVRAAAEDASKRLEKAVSGVKELEDVSKDAKERLEHTGAILGLFVMGVGLVVACIGGGVFWWTTSGLRIEATVLKKEIAQLEMQTQNARDALKILEKKTYGISFREDTNGRFIVPRKNETLKDGWTLNGQPVWKLEKR